MKIMMLMIMIRRRMLMIMIRRRRRRWRRRRRKRIHFSSNMFLYLIRSKLVFPVACDIHFFLSMICPLSSAGAKNKKQKNPT